ncbi:MAG: Glyoxalase/Bleomycin resistance protein/Dioxygenase superfamily [Frankiales bacterium]|nr:Glyoxalase/Bleomycin resistance protein/Dioxygenase superfamily [Frankiales bacterium]
MPLGHLGVNVPDLSRAKDYHDRLMPLLDYVEFFSRPEEFSYQPADGKVGTFVFFYEAAEAGDYSRFRTGVQHLAFMVPTRARVHEAHELAGSLGSEILHAPREFPEYHVGYYAAFWLDPFGMQLEVVCHRLTTEPVISPT